MHKLEQPHNILILSPWVRSIILVTHLLLVCCVSVIAQNDKIAQLRRSINTHNNKDTVWVDQVNQLSWEFSSSRPDSSRYYAQLALAQAERLGFYKGMARAYNLLGVIAINAGREQEAHQLNDRALPLAKMSGDSFILSVVLNDLAIIYHSKNQSELSSAYYLQSLDYTPRNDTIGRVYTNGNIALLYMELGHNHLAEKYLASALKASNISKDPYILEVYKSIECEYYQLAGDHEKALQSIQEAYDIAYRHGHYTRAIRFLCKEARQYLGIGQHERALSVLEQARVLAQTQGCTVGNEWIEKDMMEVLQATARHEAVISLGRSQAAGMDSSSFDLVRMAQFHDLMADSYAALGNYELAFQHQHHVEALKDSIYQSEISQAVAELETKYQLEKKDKENEILRESRQRDAERIKNHKQINTALAIIVFLASVIMVLIFLALRQKSVYSTNLEEEVQLKTADLKARNEELEGFAYIVSHDFKEPMRNIVSFINLIERKEGKNLSEETTTYFSFVQKSARQLYALTDDVLRFSRVGKTQVELQPVDLQEVMDNISNNLQLMVEEKKAAIHYQKLPTIETSQSHIFLVLKNLIENGLIYNKSEQPMVKVSYQRKADRHQIRVQDNGIGIPVEYREKIFKMFIRLHNRQDFAGTGIGLAIVKKLVNGINGTIRVENGTEGMSTSFCVEFP